jgi:hypothetical protein
MRKVQIYIEGERIELFADEVISLTSSVQNVQDIAKVFTDFTQSFTVPASPHNNAIFQHFYESAVDGTIDHQLRREARIEIDLIPFRTGKIQIEKSNLKKGMVESYTITFYGDIRTLQDYFGEDKLATLDMTPYTHEYTGANVQTRITSSSNYDIRYPLISSDRLWQYGGGGAQDISQNSHHIHYYELFPAIKINRIFEAIETKYGIDFQGTFLSDKRFTNCFLWLKNKPDFTFYTEQKPLVFSGISSSSSLDGFFDQVENRIELSYRPDLTEDPFGLFQIYIVPIPYTLGVTAYIDVYENGNLIATYDSFIGGDYLYVNHVPGLNKKYSFVCRADGTTHVEFFLEMSYINSAGTLTKVTVEDIVGQDFIENVDISGNFPDMKISDFVAGILKQFNLTCYGLSPTSFQVETLEDWYAKGRLIDVSKYIDVDSIDIERVKLYKKISFKHEESESFINKQFYQNNGRQYGDLDQVYDYDGGEYLVQLPFENLLHQKFTGTDLQVGYSLDQNYNTYIPKPTLLYMNEQKTVSFYLNNGTTTDHITTYMPFGQDLVYNGADYTLNFGWDNSSFSLLPVNRNVFNTYYFNYLANLYSDKNRIVYCKGLFPTAILTSLKLNDRLIIRDKRYIINEIKTNTNTGEVDLVLLLDFRPLRNGAKPIIGKGIGSVTFPIMLGNGMKSATLDPGTTGVTLSALTITADTDITFTTPSLTPSYTIIAENSDDIITDFGQYIRSEENNPVSYDIGIQYEYTDGSLENDTITLIQEA